MTLIRLNSDNYDNVLMTPEAYEYVALGMSSGDHGVHTTAVVVVPEEYAPEYLTKDDILDAEWDGNDYSQACINCDPFGYED